MSEKEQENRGVDELLAETFKDDLPPGVERKMKGQLYQFRRKLETPGGAWAQRVLPKAALAAAALLMVILGGYLQATGARSILTENISLLETSILVSDQVGRSSSMVCSVELKKECGETKEYHIQWISAGLTRVDIHKTGQETAMTIWLSKSKIVIADYERGAVQEVENIDQVPDNFIKPVLVLLSPERLSEDLYGEWRIKGRQQMGECEWKTYAIIPPEQETPLEMTVDLCTYLPLEVQKVIPDPGKRIVGGKMGLKVRFRWNTPIQPQNMVPEAKGIKENA